MFRISLLLLASLGIASAQTKVAIININNAVLETAEIRKAQADLEAKYKPRQEQMERLRKEIAGLQSQLQSGADKLTPQAQQDIQLTGTRKQRELTRVTEDLQAEVDRERNEILQRTGQHMQEVVRKLAEERGLDLVVDTANAVYFKPALDITKDAVAAYDKAYPGTAPAAAPAAK
jgi:outer membrane protein